MLQKVVNLQNLSRATLLLLIGLPFVYIFSPFATPILMASFVALGLEPILRKLSTRAKRKTYFIWVLFLFFLIFILAPIIIFSIRIVRNLKQLSPESIQNSQFFRALFSLWEGAQNYIQQTTSTLGIGENFNLTKEELFAKLTPFAIEKARIILGSLPDFGLSSLVFFSFLVLFATRGRAIKQTALVMKCLPAIELDQVIEVLKSTCNLILVSIFFIGALQATIVSVGSLIFGYHEFFLIFTLTFFLSFIPIIGAAPVGALLALISLVNGNSGHALGLSIVAILAGSIDNILKPYIFSGRSKSLHPLVSLFGIIGAILVFGLPGLLVGPLILQITLELGPTMIAKLVDSQHH